jgi:hypothetical protein
MAKALAIITVESPIVVAGVVFGTGALPWPRSMVPYVVGSILLGPVMIEVAERLFRSRR